MTSIGKLVGVVGLKELRQAIEDANAGTPPHREKIAVSPLPTHTPPEKPPENGQSIV